MASGVVPFWISQYRAMLKVRSPNEAAILNGGRYVIIHSDSSRSLQMVNDVSLGLVSAWKVHLRSKRNNGESRAPRRKLSG